MKSEVNMVAAFSVSSCYLQNNNINTSDGDVCVWRGGQGLVSGDTPDFQAGISPLQLSEQ